MEIQLLFPTAIAMFDLEPQLSVEERNILLNCKTRPNSFNRSSIDTYVLENPNLDRLKKFFINSINQYLNEILVPAYDCELYITQSWTNYTEKHQQHHRHNHPNSILSGVFYVNCLKDRDQITFYRKDEPQIQIEQKSFNQTINNSWQRIPVKNNLLIVFPSQLDHEVELISSGGTRVSLSFNTFIKGTVGSTEQLTQLILGENSGKSI